MRQTKFERRLAIGQEVVIALLELALDLVDLGDQLLADLFAHVPGHKQRPVCFGIDRHHHAEDALKIGRSALCFGVVDLLEKEPDLVDQVECRLMLDQVATISCSDLIAPYAAR